MKYLFWIPIVNIAVNISLKYASESRFFSSSILDINILAYFSFLGFVLAFVLYSKASRSIDVSILFPLTKGSAIVGTALVEYILFSTYISFISGIGIVLIIAGSFLLTPKKIEK
ncbi:MAG: hypothetical protein ACRCV3_03840 [Desulfovibrionaceae bacterium]